MIERIEDDMLGHLEMEEMSQGVRLVTVLTKPCICSTEYKIIEEKEAGLMYRKHI